MSEGHEFLPEEQSLDQFTSYVFSAVPKNQVTQEDLSSSEAFVQVVREELDALASDLTIDELYFTISLLSGIEKQLPEMMVCTFSKKLSAKEFWIQLLHAAFKKDYVADWRRGRIKNRVVLRVLYQPWVIFLDDFSPPGCLISLVIPPTNPQPQLVAHQHLPTLKV